MPSKAVMLDEPTFNWANGKKMFLSFKAVSKQSKRVEQVERPMYESDWKSLYIPLIPDNMFVSDNGAMIPFHHDALKNVIQNELCLGEVSRIDFVRTEKGMSAYVHFTKWYETAFVENLRNELNTVGSKRIYRFNKYQFMCSPQFGVFRAAFLVFKINHTPIEEAPVDANVHQLAAANKYLDTLVKVQESTLEELNFKLEAQDAIMVQQSAQIDLLKTQLMKLGFTVDLGDLTRMPSHVDLGEDGKGPMTVSELLTEI